MSESEINALKLELKAAHKTITNMQLRFELVRSGFRNKEAELAAVQARLDKHEKGTKVAAQFKRNERGEPDPIDDFHAKLIQFGAVEFFGDLIEKEGYKYKDAVVIAAKKMRLPEGTIRDRYPAKYRKVTEVKEEKKSWRELYIEARAALYERDPYTGKLFDE